MSRESCVALMPAVCAYAIAHACEVVSGIAYSSNTVAQGRPLKPGDLLPLGKAAAGKPGLAVPPAWRPTYPEAGSPWEISVLPGPNSSPDYFTEDDITTLHSATYTVHYNSCAPPPSCHQPASLPVSP